MRVSILKSFTSSNSGKMKLSPRVCHFSSFQGRGQSVPLREFFMLFLFQGDGVDELSTLEIVRMHGPLPKAELYKSLVREITSITNYRQKWSCHHEFVIFILFKAVLRPFRLGGSSRLLFSRGLDWRIFLPWRLSKYIAHCRKQNQAKNSSMEIQPPLVWMSANIYINKSSNFLFAREYTSLKPEDREVERIFALMAVLRAFRFGGSSYFPPFEEKGLTDTEESSISSFQGPCLERFVAETLPVFFTFKGIRLTSFLLGGCQDSSIIIQSKDKWEIGLEKISICIRASALAGSISPNAGKTKLSTRVCRILSLQWPCLEFSSRRLFLLFSLSRRWGWRACFLSDCLDTSIIAESGIK